MKQMNIDESQLVHIDYEDPSLSSVVRQFKPVLFKEDELICCILGSGREQGSYPCGCTENEAMENWEAAFRVRLKGKSDNDELLQYIRDTLSVSKNDVW